MSLTAFRKIQIGKETTRGTGVAADRILVGTLSITPSITFHRPVDERNSLAEFKRSVPVSQGAKLRFEGDAVYDQIIHFLAMALKGGVEPTLANPTGAKHDDNGIFANLTNAIDGSLLTSETIGFTAAQDKLLVRSASKFRGLKFRGPSAAPVYNAVAATISAVEVSDGAGGWLAGTLREDGTLSAGASMGQNGMISFEPHASWASGTVDGDAGFWVRLTWSAGWTAGVKLASLQTVADPAIWVFTPNLTAKNVQDSYSVEYGDDTQFWESDFVLAENLEFTIDLNGVLGLRVDLFGRFPAKVTATAGLTEQVVEEVVGGKLQVYIDGTWATLGNTEKSSLVKSGVIRFPTGLIPVRYADGNLDFSGISEQRRHFELDLEMVVGANAVTEYDAWVAETDRAIRLKFTGPTIAGSTYLLQMDFFGRYTSEPELFTDSEGENVVRLTLGTHEDSSGNEASVTVQNKEPLL